MSAALLAGCNVHSKNPANSDGNVTIEADTNGEVNFNVPFANGKIKLPQGSMHGSDFDIDGVKLMPGSNVTGISVFAGDNGANVHMAFNAPAAPEAVRSYFVDQFKQKGVEAKLAGDTVTGKSKDGTPFTIKVGPRGSATAGTIDIQSKD
jgi:hypothetical protein